MPWKLDNGLYASGTKGRQVPNYGPSWVLHGNFGDLVYVSVPVGPGRVLCAPAEPGQEHAMWASTPLIVGPSERRWMAMIDAKSSAGLGWIIKCYTWADVLEVLEELPTHYFDSVERKIKNVDVVEVVYQQTTITVTASCV